LAKQICNQLFLIVFTKKSRNESDAEAITKACLKTQLMK